MKKLAFITLLLFLFSFNYTTAQQQKTKHENIKAYKVAYFTQQLDLTSKEAEKFWPAYNAYSKSVHALMATKPRAIKKQIKENGGIDSLSESQANQYVTNLLNYEEEFFSLKKGFYNDLKKILPIKKILKLHRSENEFNRKILSEFRKKKHSQK